MKPTTELKKKLSALFTSAAQNRAQAQVLLDAAASDEQKIDELLGSRSSVRVAKPTKHQTRKALKKAAKKHRPGRSLGASSQKVFDYMRRRPNARVRCADVAKALGLDNKTVSNSFRVLYDRELVSKIGIGLFKIDPAQAHTYLAPRGLTIEVAEKLAAEKKPMRVMEIAEKLGADRNRVDTILQRMASRGAAKKTGAGEYQHTNGVN